MYLDRFERRNDDKFSVKVRLVIAVALYIGGGLCMLLATPWWVGGVLFLAGFLVGSSIAITDPPVEK